jgi:hypothetical protein
MMVVAKLTVDHIGCRTECHSLSELYIEGIEIVAASKHLVTTFLQASHYYPSMTLQLLR